MRPPFVPEGGGFPYTPARRLPVGLIAGWRREFSQGRGQAKLSGIAASYRGPTGPPVEVPKSSTEPGKGRSHKASSQSSITAHGPRTCRPERASHLDMEKPAATRHEIRSSDKGEEQTGQRPRQNAASQLLRGWVLSALMSDGLFHPVLQLMTGHGPDRMGERDNAADQAVNDQSLNQRSPLDI